MADLAIHGGPPVRGSLLPYGHQDIDDDDIEAVVRILRSDWITTGPTVREFEDAFAASVGARHAVSFSSGTAALRRTVNAITMLLSSSTIRIRLGSRTRSSEYQLRHEATTVAAFVGVRQYQDQPILPH